MWLQYSEFVIAILQTGQLAWPHLWWPEKLGCIVRWHTLHTSKSYQLVWGGVRLVLVGRPSLDITSGFVKEFFDELTAL